MGSMSMPPVLPRRLAQGYRRCVPERPDPNLDAVRSALRAHDHAPAERPPAGPPGIGYGPSELEDGVSTTRLDPTAKGASSSCGASSASAPSA